MIDRYVVTVHPLPREGGSFKVVAPSETGSERHTCVLCRTHVSEKNLLVCVWREEARPFRQSCGKCGRPLGPPYADGMTLECTCGQKHVSAARSRMLVWEVAHG